MMAEMPTIAPRNLAQAMRDVVETHTVIRDNIRARADEIAALREADDRRRTSENGLGYKAP